MANSMPPKWLFLILICGLFCSPIFGCGSSSKPTAPKADDLKSFVEEHKLALDSDATMDEEEAAEEEGAEEAAETDE